MKFKQVMNTIFELPANAFTGLTNLVLGSTVKVKGRDGVERVKEDLDGNPVTTRGLVGYLADGIKTVSRATADFLSNHKKAIATAAWISLLAAGAVALTLFLWPAALAAVATFSIGGLSIAAIAGASTVAQIGLAAGLAAAAASVATYVTAGLVNGFKWLAECCKGLRASSKKTGSKGTDLLIEEDEDFGKGLGTTFSSSNPYSSKDLRTTKREETGLENRSGTVVPMKREDEVTQFPSPLKTAKKEETPVVDTSNTIRLSGSNP
ncbi:MULTISPECIES: hypothetical protein [Legionella]|uniref:Transmembrane protein n=1 Tax=Legionella resiliens TaxID=2905958 RepID=A0ABS8X1P9_9GAMM|nr:MULTISPECIES: hypothetical protein [unclassified Legionella]MCE0722206.1 hypothetical protein [Legionella sp. 9fVS26]MCE3531360.1 hypothetical protein [Legionella sp. 8cVS16]QLZ67375.1 hypothetical protein FOLKNPGA_00140 [Legionella sp. PC1000]